MAIETTILGVTLGLLLAIVLLRYSGYLDHIKRAVAFIVAGVFFYIVDIAWTAGTFVQKLGASSDIVGWLTFIWELVAFILVVIGAVWAAAELVSKAK